MASEILPSFKAAGLPRPVSLRSVELLAGQLFEVHSHPWNQLVYATSGSLVVMLEQIRYVITPEQAIWIPTDVTHTSGSLGDASFRSLYVDDVVGEGMPKRCAVLSVSSFLRALIVELFATNSRGDETEYLEHIEALILYQLRRARPRDFSLPWPKSTPLRKLCESLYERPGDERTSEQWGRQLAIAPRTLARRFEAEVGITLREWRGRLRLFRALEWLGAGRSVTSISIDLGYASPSAFAFMFRQEMGCSPTEWQKSS